jgi:cobalt/nickel transport system permease protein
LHHARIERWGREDSPIHRRHATAKIVAALSLLVSIATLTNRSAGACAAWLLLLMAVTLRARLPLGRILLNAAAVLPFALCFAAISALSGQPERAVILIVKGYLSSLTALLLISTTPMPDLLAGLELLHAPQFLLQVMQFLYRYLIVLMEEALAMRDAVACRAGNLRWLAVRQAAGAAGVLFARSYGRAQAIHRAMIARGFDRHIPRLRILRFRAGDAYFAVAAAVLAVGVRVVLG